MAYLGESFMNGPELALQLALEILNLILAEEKPYVVRLKDKDMEKYANLGFGYW